MSHKGFPLPNEYQRHEGRLGEDRLRHGQLGNGKREHVIVALTGKHVHCLTAVRKGPFSLLPWHAYYGRGLCYNKNIRSWQITGFIDLGGTRGKQSHSPE